jgi:hypothetical protein
MVKKSIRGVHVFSNVMGLRAMVRVVVFSFSYFFLIRIYLLYRAWSEFHVASDVGTDIRAVRMCRSWVWANTGDICKKEVFPRCLTLKQPTKTLKKCV